MDIRTIPAEHEALSAGIRAGQLRVAAGANPYELGTIEYSEWERGRSSVEAQRSAAEIRSRARSSAPCLYRSIACDCGGRGLCLDVA